jgi:SAM-dependent methyltransferase
VEYAEPLVEAARRRLALEHVSVGDLRRAGFGDGYFAVVYSWHVIEHVLDVRAWLAEIARVLAPGGVLVLGTESADAVYGRLWCLPFRLLRRLPWPPTSADHTYWFSAGQLEALLTQAGFEVRRLDVYEEPPVEIARSLRRETLRHPRATAAFMLYLLSSVVSVVRPRLGGKLAVVAVRP